MGDGRSKNWLGRGGGFLSRGRDLGGGRGGLRWGEGVLPKMG